MSESGKKIAPPNGPYILWMAPRPQNRGSHFSIVLSMSHAQIWPQRVKFPLKLKLQAKSYHIIAIQIELIGLYYHLIIYYDH